MTTIVLIIERSAVSYLSIQQLKNNQDHSTRYAWQLLFLAINSLKSSPMVHCVLSHSLTASVSLCSHLALTRMASQFCLTTRSAMGQGLSLKNCSTSRAFSSVTNPAVPIWGGERRKWFEQSAITWHLPKPLRGIHPGFLFQESLSTVMAIYGKKSSVVKTKIKTRFSMA